jgi:hypothetical protein
VRGDGRFIHKSGHREIAMHAAGDVLRDAVDKDRTMSSAAQPLGRFDEVAVYLH